jgi:hypothetical protein
MSPISVDPPNWVERKARRENLLRADSEVLAVWNALRNAIQDACDSFNKYYAHDQPEDKVKCLPENGRRIRVERAFPKGRMYGAEQHSVLIQLSDLEISVVSDLSVTLPTLKIDADHNEVYLSLGAQRMTSDEVSERVLEPLLFPRPR